MKHIIFLIALLFVSMPVLAQKKASETGYGTQNLVINGAFDFWQRATSASVGTGCAYTADRFMTRTAGSASGGTVARDTSVPGTEFKYSFKFTNAGDLTDNHLSIFHRIEAANIRSMIGKSATVSFWLKTDNSEGLNDLRLDILTPVSATADTWNAECLSDTTAITGPVLSLASTGAWKKFTYTFTVPANAQYGMALKWTTVTSLNLATSYWLSGVMLNIGDRAAPFALAGGTIGGEYLLAQRYYQTWSSPTTRTVGYGHLQTGTTYNITVPTVVPLRATPTLTNPSLAAAFMQGTSLGSALSSITLVDTRPYGLTLAIVASSGVGANSVYVINGSQPFTADAEL